MLSYAKGSLRPPLPNGLDMSREATSAHTSSIQFRLYLHRPSGPARRPHMSRPFDAIPMHTRGGLMESPDGTMGLGWTRGNEFSANLHPILSARMMLMLMLREC